MKTDNEELDRLVGEYVALSGKAEDEALNMIAYLSNVNAIKYLRDSNFCIKRNTLLKSSVLEQFKDERVKASNYHKIIDRNDIIAFYKYIIENAIDRPITAKEIYKVTGLKPRKIAQISRVLVRTYHIPIIANNSGYFYTVNSKKIDHALNREYSRMRELNQYTRGLRHIKEDNNA